MTRHVESPPAYLKQDSDLKNGGLLERAATMANRASTRTTQLNE